MWDVNIISVCVCVFVRAREMEGTWWKLPLATVAPSCGQRTRPVL